MIPIAIVATEQRFARAEKLAAITQAEYIALDDGHLGPGYNHDEAWKWVSKSGHHWSVVLEDDAIPIKPFQRQLKKMLSVAPTPIVSLYLGRGRPPHWQPSIARVAHVSANFLIGSTLLHHVGVAMRTDLVPIMLEQRNHNLPVDESIGAWAQQHGLHVSYSWPSLVDHDDKIPTTIKKRTSGYKGETGKRTEVRKAWNFGKRLNWEKGAVWIPTPNV